MKPDLEKLRRFALAIGLVLITYSLAVAAVEPDPTVSILGLKFSFNRAWIPAGLVLTSAYSLIRFWLYGVATTDSPRRVRMTTLLRFEGEVTKAAFRRINLNAVRDRESEIRWRKKVEFEEAEFEEVKAAVLATYPRVAGKSPQFKDGGPLDVPVACRVAAWFQDLDYLAPIWVNALALGCFFLGQTRIAHLSGSIGELGGAIGNL